LVLGELASLELEPLQPVADTVVAELLAAVELVVVEQPELAAADHYYYCYMMQRHQEVVDLGSLFGVVDRYKVLVSLTLFDNRSIEGV